MAAAIENVMAASRRFINRRGVIQRANEQGLATRRNDSADRQGDGQLVQYSRPASIQTQAHARQTVFRRFRLKSVMQINPLGPVILLEDFKEDVFQLQLLLAKCD